MNKKLKSILTNGKIMLVYRILSHFSLQFSICRRTSLVITSEFYNAKFFIPIFTNVSQLNCVVSGFFSGCSRFKIKIKIKMRPANFPPKKGDYFSLKLPFLTKFHKFFHGFFAEKAVFSWTIMIFSRFHWLRPLQPNAVVFFVYLRQFNAHLPRKWGHSGTPMSLSGPPNAVTHNTAAKFRLAHWH